MVEVPRDLLWFQPDYSRPREAARALRICAGSYVFGARHVRQEAPLDAVELDVQSGRIQEFEFRGRVRAAVFFVQLCTSSSTTSSTASCRTCLAPNMQLAAQIRSALAVSRGRE